MVQWSSVRPTAVNDALLPFISRGFVQESGSRILWHATFLHFEFRRLGFSVPVNKFVLTWGDILCRLNCITAGRDVIFNPAAVHGTGHVDGEAGYQIYCVAHIICF